MSFSHRFKIHIHVADKSEMTRQVGSFEGLHDMFLLKNKNYP